MCPTLPPPVGHVESPQDLRVHITKTQATDIAQDEKQQAYITSVDQSEGIYIDVFLNDFLVS